jgi:hypothetical protein
MGVLCRTCFYFNDTGQKVIRGGLVIDILGEC